MIPLGLKETKEIELRDSFKDFILEHYRFYKCKVNRKRQDVQCIKMNLAVRTVTTMRTS